MENLLRKCNERVVVVAEIGINHNGDLKTCTDMIDAAKWAGADAVKFQKRDVEVVYSQAELDAPRASPFGSTNRLLKHALEFTSSDYFAIQDHCARVGIPWFASPWDTHSVAFLETMECPAYKVASACVTDMGLIRAIAETKKPVIMSTGMSSLPEIKAAADQIGSWLALLVTTASYPCKVEDLNLARIGRFIDETVGMNWVNAIGYSGHEVGLWTTLCAVAMGARIVERHFTLDRTMWGSDQSASIEPQGMKKLVDEIRTFDKALGRSEIHRLPCEEVAYEKLRRFK